MILDTQDQEPNLCPVYFRTIKSNTMAVPLLP